MSVRLLLEGGLFFFREVDFVRAHILTAVELEPYTWNICISYV